ncbi:MAG TPA: 2-phosphosulfolactate phosphatase [Ktedonobacterales bacterium]|nr:2-phosphosulfolactate phosphatase [Ktedonobacterales bacterium]
MAKTFDIVRIHGSNAEQARGVVVVIDVLRAFTVSAYALAGGARELLLVRGVEEALTLRDEAHPEALLAGEVGGRLIPGFDLNNSPARMQASDVRDRLIIQRTGAGTQGAVNARHASRLLVASLVNAHATAAYAARLAETIGAVQITLVPTASSFEDGGRQTIEDEACADYLEALLTGRDDSDAVLAHIIERISAVECSGIFFQGMEDFPAGDVTAALAANRFDFAMEGERHTLGEIAYIAVRRVDVDSD